MKNKKQFIKEWVLKNQEEKNVKEFVKMYGVEGLVNMLYDCYLNTEAELSNNLLNNLFYINFVVEE